MSRAISLDALLDTFTKDQQFCDALAKAYPVEIARFLIYVRWAQLHFSDIQDELHEIAKQHFPQPHLDEAQFWSLALTGGIRKDISLVPYLVLRGLLMEAGSALRRSMENVGLLAHLWHDPKKAALLGGEDQKAFRQAFENEPDAERREALKALGAKKRFEKCLLAPTLSTLYDLLSRYSIHGGSPSQLVTAEVRPTRFSCGLVNRSDPAEKDLSDVLTVLTNGVQMLCVEITAIHGQFGKQYGILPSKGGEGGFFLTQLLEEGNDAPMARLVQQILSELGWSYKEKNSNEEDR